ncbi:hypothetical protein [Devosia psychrophila]|uniref:Ribbon-helix-helix protein, copG family n=1 Tax=Devosia psychrophila TaxID=728005 RepID=A0A0F5Q215_9HYPH|nr:hypothetical protein [Devosia psychrophila]KKC34967.1 hypothetical protein WH91_00010 [Devosia psychrophila]SFD46488.1 hypothetical protein SAMN04488059_1703 [Devosia psychrophila]
MSANLDEQPKIRKRKDGRRQVLVQLRPDTIEQLRAAAAAEDRYVYEIIEELVTDYLAQVNFKL